MDFSKNDNNPFIRIFDVWGRKTPSYEIKYEDTVIKVLTDFGKGTNGSSDAKGKVLGAGYEALIMAFFIGLYKGKSLPFDDEPIKDLGQPIQYWGNLDSKKKRKAYPRLKDYIFISLVARTPDIDWLEVDKGKWTVSQAVSLLMMTMEGYINYGLSIIEDKLKEDEAYFYNNSAFIDIFRDLTMPKPFVGEMNNPDIPESLD